MPELVSGIFVLSVSCGGTFKRSPGSKIFSIMSGRRPALCVSNWRDPPWDIVLHRSLSPTFLLYSIEALPIQTESRPIDLLNIVGTTSRLVSFLLAGSAPQLHSQGQPMTGRSPVVVLVPPYRCPSPLPVYYRNFTDTPIEHPFLMVHKNPVTTTSDHLLPLIG